MPPRRPEPEKPDPRQKVGISKELDRLAAQIERFRVDAQRFFAGDLGVPPEPLRDAIQTQIREFRTASRRSVADTYRLNSLEARFNSHLELFGRRLRSAEEGKAARRAAETKPDAERGVVLGKRTESGAVEALYKSLYLRSGANPSMGMEKFRGYLGKQVANIRTKTGCENIQFRVVDEGGKLKLKARPVRDS